MQLPNTHAGTRPPQGRQVTPTHRARRWGHGLVVATIAATSFAGAAWASMAELEAAAGRDGSVRVIVELDGGETVRPGAPERTSVERSRRRIATTQQRVLKRLGVRSARIRHAFHTVPFIAVEADRETLRALAADPEVRRISLDRIEYLNRDGVERAALAETIGLIGADAAVSAGYDGSGRAIAIVDTGVDASHPMLSGKVVAEACYTGGADCPNGSVIQVGTGAGAPCAFAPMGCAHGTHVAGIAAGRPMGELQGVAPGADIIAIQVFSSFTGGSCAGDDEDPCPAAFVSDQIAALERVFELRNTFDVAAVNISIGGSTKFTSESECDADQVARKAAIDNLRSVGIPTIVASGNEGFLDGLTTPACISSAISIGAVTDNDAVAIFSNSASFLDLLAPGAGVRSAFPGGSIQSLSGTSMAAPHVSGALAILGQASPGSGTETLLMALSDTGHPVTDGGNDVVTPRVDLVAALTDLGVNTTATPTTVGVIELPVNGADASGVGIFSVWVCDANELAMRINGGDPIPMAYGLPRDDTIPVCGDNDNGGTLLWNFPLQGDGMHTAELLADGEVVDTVTFSVSTFGTPFFRGGIDRVYTLEDFGGFEVDVQWLQAAQNFVIIDIREAP